MNRLAALLLCSTLVVCAAVAAPTPLPKKQRPVRGIWFNGWDKPIDPVGNCRFDRKGDKMIITVPGKGYSLERKGLPSSAPMLLRDVEGDFIAQVRAAGSIVPAGVKGKRLACLLLMDGQKCIQCFGYNPTNRLGPAFLRIDRQGQMVTVKSSKDGEQWEIETGPDPWAHSRKLKVGVMVELEAEGVFKAEFDQFKLIPLGEKSR